MSPGDHTHGSRARAPLDSVTIIVMIVNTLAVGGRMPATETHGADSVMNFDREIMQIEPTHAHTNLGTNLYVRART